MFRKEQTNREAGAVSGDSCVTMSGVMPRLFFYFSMFEAAQVFFSDWSVSMAKASNKIKLILCSMFSDTCKWIYAGMR